MSGKERVRVERLVVAHRRNRGSGKGQTRVTLALKRSLFHVCCDWLESQTCAAEDILIAFCRDVLPTTATVRDHDDDCCPLTSVNRSTCYSYLFRMQDRRSDPKDDDEDVASASVTLPPGALAEWR